MMGTEVAKTKKVSLLAKMAAKSDLDPQVFLSTIKQTVIKGPASNEQITAFLMVANRYELDPILKEIHAFTDKSGGVVPIVGVDGWISMAQRHPQFDGEEIRWAPTMVKPEGGKRCPEWCEYVVYRKDRSHPTVIREYLDECYRKTGPWQSHTKRMLRHKAMIQAYRVAFGFSGLYDEDEAERIAVEMPSIDVAAKPSRSAERARQVLTDTPGPAVPPAADTAPSTSPDEQIEVDEVTGEVMEVEEEAFVEDIVPVEEEAPVEEAEVEEADEMTRAVEAAKQVLDAVEEPEEAHPVPPATKKQLEALEAAKKQAGWTDEHFTRLLAEDYGVKKPESLNREQALEVIRILLAAKEEGVQEGLGF